MRHCVRLLLVAALLSTPAAGANETTEREQREAELEAVRGEIEAVREALAADREARDAAAAEVEALEREIASVTTRIEAVMQRVEEQRERLSAITAERAEAGERLDAQRERLAEQVRAAYRLGREPALRLLLRQDDPAVASRAMGYYAYINAARLDAMAEVSALLDRLAALEQEAEATAAGLAGDRDELDRRRERLAAARVEREEMLVKLEAEVDAGDERLAELEADREHLVALLRELGSVVADTPASPLDAEPFAERSGRLEWPVSGRVQSAFGSERAGGRLRWQGIVIGAGAGSRVRAVHHGQVVFADWMSGFGHLIILDHRDGYMSLYGFNQRLLRGEGEWVEPGEAIAVVGDSGARDGPGLYFGIRRDGEPHDPIAWLE